MRVSLDCIKVDVHVEVDGRVKQVAEYGEEFDGNNVISCYVPVEEGDKIRIGGKLEGEATQVAYDATIDGVLRKTVPHSGKTDLGNRHKKIAAELFLHKNADGTIVETGVRVAAVSQQATHAEDKVDTAGVLEVYVYVSKNEVESHTISGIEKYYGPEDQTPTYSKIPLQFQLNFEKADDPLSKKSAKRQKDKTNGPRPGPAPFLIFRFLYRSEESILEHGLPKSFDPETKSKKYRSLTRDSANSGTESGEDDASDDDDGTTPSTPMNSRQDEAQTPATETLRGTAARTKANALLEEFQAIPPPKAPVFDSSAHDATDKDTPISGVTGGSPHPVDSPMDTAMDTAIEPTMEPTIEPSMEPTMPIIEPAMGSSIVTPTRTFGINEGSTKPAIARKQNVQVVVPASKSRASKQTIITDSFTSTSTDSATGRDRILPSIEKTAEVPEHDTILVNAKGPSTPNTSNSVRLAPSADVRRSATVAMNEDTTKQGSAETYSVEKNTGHNTTSSPSAHRRSSSDVSVKSVPSKPSGEPGKRISALSSSPVAPMSAPVQARAHPFWSQSSPLKRRNPPSDIPATNTKRTKLEERPKTPQRTVAPPVVSSPIPSSPMPKLGSIEHRLAGTRKHLEEVNMRREALRKRQEEVDRKMENYKQRMEEELAQLEEQVEAAEAQFLSEEEYYNVSSTQLAEYQKGDDGT